MSDYNAIKISSGVSDNNICDMSDTVTLDFSDYVFNTTGTGYDIGTIGGSIDGLYSSDTITWTGNYDYNYHSSISIKEGGDLKIGERSLKDFMDRVEDRLAILRPNEELEERWEELKNLRRQYEILEKDIIEKERIMKILKDEE